MNIVKRFNGTESTAVSPTPSAVALPAGLVIAPGTYTFNGENFNCAAEGLYRFWTPMGATRHAIVYQSDVGALMSALAWLTVNGRADEALTLSAKTNLAVNSKLRMLCGKTAEWTLSLCSSLGIQARQVRSLTGETPTNYYDGHVMVEAKVGGQWKLYDLSNNFTYTAGTGSALRDVLPLVPATVTNAIAADGYSIEPWSSGAFDVTAWIENTMQNPAAYRAELERVLQIPGIDHSDGLTYFYLPAGMESRQAWVLGLQASFRVITKSAWEAMFYPA